MAKGAYARSRGRTPAWLSKQIKEGKLGPPAITPGGKVIPDMADKMIAGLVRPSMPRRKAAKPPVAQNERTPEPPPGPPEPPKPILMGRKPKRPPRDLSNVVDFLPDNARTGEIMPPGHGEGPQAVLADPVLALAYHRTRREKIQADREEWKFKQETGQLVEVAEVKLMGADLAQIVRDTIEKHGAVVVGRLRSSLEKAKALREWEKLCREMCGQIADEVEARLEGLEHSA